MEAFGCSKILCYCLSIRLSFFSDIAEFMGDLALSLSKNHFIGVETHHGYLVEVFLGEFEHIFIFLLWLLKPSKLLGETIPLATIW